jgi:hypothetical protein
VKFYVRILVYIVCCSLSFARTWTDTDGRSLEAELVRKETDGVILKTPDGKEFKLPLTRLSKESKALLADVPVTGPPSLPDKSAGVELKVFFSNPLNASADKVAQANQLLAKADSLGGSNSVTVVGGNGVVINGVSLTGLGVVRPGILRTRAAELLTEEATDKTNLKLLKQALDLWAQLGDSTTPVAYFRRAAMRKGAENSEFALSCRLALARCYLRQGDQVSALGILQPYAVLPTTSEIIGRLQVAYAEQLLVQGQLDAAAKLALQVRDNCPMKELEFDSVI